MKGGGGGGREMGLKIYKNDLRVIHLHETWQRIIAQIPQCKTLKAVVTVILVIRGILE